MKSIGFMCLGVPEGLSFNLEMLKTATIIFRQGWVSALLFLGVLGRLLAECPRIGTAHG